MIDFHHAGRVVSNAVAMLAIIVVALTFTAAVHPKRARTSKKLQNHLIPQRAKRIAKSAAISSSALERGTTVANSECFDREREH